MAYEFYQNTLTVPAALLYEDGEILTKPNYDKLCRVGKIRRAREGKGLGNYALVEFDTIPERFRVKIIKKLGYPPKKQVQHQILKYRSTDYEAVDFFATYMIDEHRTLSPEHQEQYVADAEMLQALDAYIKEMKMFRKSRGGSITKVWVDAAKALAEVKEQTGHKLPGTDRRLRDKLEAFQKDGYKSLISEKFLGKNAAKVKDPAQEALLRSILRDHRNLDNEMIARIYEHTAQVMGWKSLTASGIANYRKLWKLYTYGGNHGEKAFDNYVGMTVKRTAPSSPLLYWTLDGWDSELYYQRTDEKGTTYHNRLTMVVVLDPSLKYPIGYAIGRAETTDLIRQAIRNAVLHTEELFGTKHKVLQIQSDNYGKKAMLPIYEAFSQHYTPAKVGNAKSKVIEPWFNYFNKKYCQLMSNWSGHGVKAAKQPNPEYLQKIKASFPDEFGCTAQLTAFIEREREELREKFLQAYAEMPDDAKKFVTEQEFLLHFGQETGFLNSRSHSGIAPKIEGIRYYYDSFDMDFRKYDSLSWRIKYNPEDLSQVLAYNEEHQLRFLLRQKHEQPMALYDRMEGDGEQLQLVRSFNREIKNEILEVQAEDARTVSEFFTDHKELDGSLVKTLLTDSRGQHKNLKNAKRLETAQKMITKQEVKEQKKTENDWTQAQEQYLKQKVNLNKYLEND
ncbi:hypothetical protein EGI11_03130 [Chryseobacterium sp. H3056]|uniref:Integrase catalytic domain-containing protein n=1 Tax=Kaistella daneshvariae TaxID=2487074 RepID=A0A3N0WXF5_9FLAO|nr:hypothetical protein [Kaistella daneshvariae]ROI09764.1 hypothetical protein EGI11_03130 [Kaistella daneshvariae]